jgi:hypothetical protein
MSSLTWPSSISSNPDRVVPRVAGANPAFAGAPSGTFVTTDAGTFVVSRTGTITQNSTNPVTLQFNVPRNAQIMSFNIDVLTVFNSASSAVLSAGITASGTEYVSSVDVKTAAGRIVPAYTGTQLTNMANVGDNNILYVRVTPTGATSTGLVRVSINFTVPFGSLVGA